MKDAQTGRPINLTLFPQPFPAIVSISHRITGGVLFVGVAFCLYALDLALSSPAGFDEARVLIAQPFSRLIFLGLIFVLVFHVLAGIKHLLLDFHMGDSYEAARIGASVIVVGTVIITGLLGVALW